jgi:hypothetical protein
MKAGRCRHSSARFPIPRANPRRCQWLRLNAHRSDPSGTMIAYRNSDPNRSPRRVRLNDGFPRPSRANFLLVILPPEPYPRPPPQATCSPRQVALLFARHVLSLGDASSLRAVVNGTARLGQGVRREAESEGSRRQNSDSTNRNRIQGRSRRVTRQWTRMPDIHPEA